MPLRGSPLAGARAFPGPSAPGRFRKASNLNYALRLADRLEGGEPLSEAHARFRGVRARARLRARTLRAGDVQRRRDHRPARQGQRDAARRDPGDRARVPGRPDARLHAARLVSDQRGALLLGGDRLVHPAALRPRDPRQVSDRGIAHARSWATTCSCAARTSSAWAAGTSTRCARISTLCCGSTSRGSHGKYIAYPGHEFGEAVTRVYTEELEKFRRYAFGAAEAVLNPISEWERRGIVKESWRRFCRSEHVRWYQVVDLLQFFFSLVNLASLVPIALLTGLGFVHPYRALSMAADVVRSSSAWCRFPPSTCCGAGAASAAMPAGRDLGARGSAPGRRSPPSSRSRACFVGYVARRDAGARWPISSTVRSSSRRRTPTTSAGSSRRAHLRAPVDAPRGARRSSLLLVAGRRAGGLAHPPRPELRRRERAIRLALPLRVALSRWSSPRYARWLFHPYIVGGRDLPRSGIAHAARAPQRAAHRTEDPQAGGDRAAEEPPDVADWNTRPEPQTRSTTRSLRGGAPRARRASSLGARRGGGCRRARSSRCRGASRSTRAAASRRSAGRGCAPRRPAWCAR